MVDSSLRIRVAGVALVLGACTYWEPYSPSRYTDLPSSLRVPAESGHPILLVEPFIRNDTLLGRVGRDTVGVPLNDSRGVQRQRVDGLRTLGAIVGVSAVWITVGLLTGGLE
jgi:hypothetical protein